MDIDRCAVMAALVAAIHVLLADGRRGCAGRSPDQARGRAWRL